MYAMLVSRLLPSSPIPLPPPCIKPWKQLRRVVFTDLTRNTVTKDTCLIVNVKETPECEIANLVFRRVQDADGVELSVIVPFGMWFEDSEQHTQWEELDFLCIKEPMWLTGAGGRNMVTCACPTNALKLMSPDVPSKGYMNPDLDFEQREVENYKNQRWGMLQSSATMAIQNIDAGLSSFPADMKSNFLALRARARANRGQFDGAIADAKAVLAANKPYVLEHSVDAHIIIAQSAYELQNFKEAKISYTFLAKHGSRHSAVDYKKELGRVTQRLAEQSTGRYDWYTIGRMVAEKQETHYIDRASFTGNVQMKLDRPGLYAVKNFKAGDFIFCEKALTADWLPENRTSPTDKAFMLTRLLAIALYKLCHNPTRYITYRQWHGKQKNASPGLVDGVFVLDPEELMRSLKSLAPGCTMSEPNKLHLQAFWIVAAKFRGECIGNARAVHLGDLFVVNATKDIKEGQEIKLSSAAHDEPSCQHEDCPWCATCQLRSVSENQQRAAVITALNEAQTKTPGSIQRLTHLATRLREMYDKHFVGLPYFGLIRRQARNILEQSDLQALNLHKKRSKEHSLDRLRDHGYFLTWLPDQGLYKIDRSSGVVDLEVAVAAANLSVAHKAADETAAADQAKEFAYETYRLFSGTNFGSAVLDAFFE
eukprot:Blabericola_migrator_1__2159@NODE_1596_length_4206_cov_133_794395_g1044_i0_p1_GENE_NODE_1596_length_4206_cov_133_794395_g1044_i0NODE_1596_length_4206_cov_133_794395_g1044_i0_p1_ORF_typecomplete_len652_score73_44TPR_16/PF13432_6/1e05SET/PF00856_28/0_0012SET/PF00856_28/3_3ANAPC3/PF12895_7/0_0029ANAPC3/PF12895_7/4_2e03TPR_15/PF13429_6/0_067TPR_14/PF13428_6/0_56TPR_14/PF13428_6/4_6e03TPR_2/PF07719_17/1_2e02TPR_2/PF07719_17/9_3TPR_9/PF13371_6/0_26TPR_9/PF13371_6/4_8e03_NODE_1596_length_4206_cov_133_7